MQILLVPIYTYGFDGRQVDRRGSVDDPIYAFYRFVKRAILGAALELS